MKRIGIAMLLFALVLCVAIPLASADNDPVVITPYIGGPDYHVEAGTEVVIRAGWGACTRGLAEAFRHQALVSMEIQRDGAPFLVVEPPSREYWRDPQPIDGNYDACVMNTRNGWTTQWLYSLGALDAGSYAVHFHWYLEHPMPDGGDHDGDGRVDLIDLNAEHDVTLIVE